MQIIKKIKSILIGYKTPKCVGLDLASSSSKMVELSGNTLKISNYSFKDMKVKLISDSAGIAEVEKLSEHILEQWNLFKPKYKSIAIAIPHHAVITKDFEIPIIKNKYKQYDHIKAMIVQELNVDQIDFDYNIIAKDENTQIASVVIAKKEKIEEYQAMIQMTGLNIAAIDVESYCVSWLLNSLVARYQLVQPTVFISIGINTLKAYTYLNGEYKLYRDLDININQLLLDIWLEINDNDKIDYAVLFNYLNTNHNASSKLAEFIADKINVLFSVINNNLMLEAQVGLTANSQIYLFGGNSLIPGLIDKLHERQYSAKYLDILLPENQHISRDKLLRLIEAISLATWGKSNVA